MVLEVFQSLRFKCPPHCYCSQLQTYLFIYGLFNDSDNNLDYTVSNDSIINE
jgi:hypothetical protein